MTSNNAPNSEQDSLPSPQMRILLSTMILGYLSIVMLGPLSNPVASKHLTDPLSRPIAPIHQAMFLGHGYRFFGPDPGPSHIVEYVVTRNDGETIPGQFPDRDEFWPRLRYHRWFMLSETIYEESLGLVDEKEHREFLSEINSEIDAARMQNARPVMDELVQDRDSMQTNYEYLQKRVDGLLDSVAQYLLAKHQGESVELFLRERLIARPVDIQSRVKLTDPRYLSEPRKLGKFVKTESALEALN